VVIFAQLLLLKLATWNC